jgi:hypothetical protein
VTDKRHTYSIVSTGQAIRAGHVGVQRLFACARDQRGEQNGHSRLVRPLVPRRCGAMESGGAAHRRAFRLPSALVPAPLRRHRYRGRSVQRRRLRRGDRAGGRRWAIRKRHVAAARQARGWPRPWRAGEIAPMWYPATKSYLEAFAKLEAGDPGAMAAFAAHVGKHASFHLKRLLNGASGTQIVMDYRNVETRFIPVRGRGHQ